MQLMPPLQTANLLIRPFTIHDLDDIHQLLDIDLATADFGTAGATSRAERQKWLQWTVMNYEELAKLYQPPYGDRAVTLQQTGQLIGSCGYVPSFGPFEQLPSFHPTSDTASERLYTPAFGLFYAFSPAFQRKGYATEAARALVDYAFTQLHLQRIVATTTYDNAASMGVMRKLGMSIEKNPLSEPPWFQVVGMLANSLQREP